MAEMNISSLEPNRMVQDYDILLENGMMLPITIDRAAGDTVEFIGDIIQFTLVPKPSMNDPTKMLPAEDITVFKPHVLSIQHREREIVSLTPEQKYQLSQTLQELSGTIN